MNKRNVDLEKAVLLNEHIVKDCPRDLNMLMYLTNLGSRYLSSFEQIQDGSYLEKAIVVLQKAVNCTRQDHSRQGFSLSQLGHALQLKKDPLALGVYIRVLPVRSSTVSVQKFLTDRPDPPYEKQGTETGLDRRSTRNLWPDPTDFNRSRDRSRPIQTGPDLSTRSKRFGMRYSN